MRKRAFALLVVSAITPAASASAQPLYERFSLASTAALDVFGGDNVSSRPQIIIDIVGTARLGGGWQAFIRPWFRQPRPTAPGAEAPPWDAQIYQASLRYEHNGAVSTRVDLGYMPSPIGLGIFDVNPKQNPVISGHSSYFTPMLPFDTGTGNPRVPAIASTYPLAGVVTASTTKLDARVGVANSSPVRISIAGVKTNPDSTPVIEAGAGVTPLIGLRLGMSFAHGAYLTGSEIAPSSSPQTDRMLTLVGLESEYAFRYTRLTGEVVHDTLGAPGGNVGATTWFVQGQQVIPAAPRWYLAGRHEGTSSPIVGFGVVFGAQPTMMANEVTAGFRVSRDVLLKASYYTRRPYGRIGDWDHQGAVQAVWDHRWW
jgi:hypothetical protein